jgi:hypothetical protein
MANPNRAMAHIAKRSPIEEIRCNNLWHAQTVADEKRAAGFDAKATQRKIGPRANPTWVFTCYVYNKL